YADPLSWWNSFMEIARHSEDERRDFPDGDGGKLERLLEALARGGPAVAQRAMAIITDQSITDRREEFCVKLLGRMRHEGAIDVIIDKLRIEGADFLCEAAAEALIKIGTTAAIARIRERYLDESWGVRLFLNGPLEHIKLPESEEALLWLVEPEPEI